MSFYQFNKPIRRVAVIGGGPSGIPAARHLRDAGLDVVVFDQQPEVGGVWNYSEERIETPSIPPHPSSGARTLLDVAELSEVSPFTWSTPCYWNLRNNVPTKTMAVCVKHDTS
jgi:cation diffusion facilitator CzcD-associated flavoprotein CzcO